MQIKKSRWTFFLLIVLLCSCTSTESKTETGLSLLEALEQSAVKTAGELLKSSRVAVVAFDSANDDLSEFIMEEFNGALKDCGIEVVDRQNLTYVFQELNFQRSEYVSDETALSIGKFLGADIVITGQLTKFGSSYRYRINALNVETAARISITRLDVRDGQELRSMTEGMQR